MLYDKLNSGPHPHLGKFNEILWRWRLAICFLKAPGSFICIVGSENCYSKSNGKGYVMGALKLSDLYNLLILNSPKLHAG